MFELILIIVAGNHNPTATHIAHPVNTKEECTTAAKQAHEAFKRDGYTLFTVCEKAEKVRS